MEFYQKYDVPFPDGESDEQFVARVRKFFNDEVVPVLSRGENVLIVTHDGVLQALEVILESMEMKDLWGLSKRNPNAMPITYIYESGMTPGVVPIKKIKKHMRKGIYRHVKQQ